MIKPAIMELLGAFVITFFGCYSRLNNEDDFFAIGLTYFLLISGLTYAFKNISGGQFNPILSVSLIITNQISAIKGILYFVCHIVGSILAGIIIFLVTEGDELNYGEPVINEDQKSMGASLEMISMFFLVYMYNSLYSDTNAPKDIYGGAYGGIYLFCICAFGLISGGCINLVSLIGPSLFSGNFKDWPYYIGGQLVGGVLSGLIFKLFLTKSKVDEEDTENEKVKSE